MNKKQVGQDPLSFERAPKCVTTLRGTKGSGTRRKMLKVLSAGTLALFMGIVTLCGVLLAPMNAAQVSTSTGETSQTFSAEEKLVTGQGLGLDPENDPVIYTTESGLDIKFGAANLSSGVLSGYAYFTMGTYGGKTINWVIIGRSTNGFSSTTINSLAWHLLGQGGSSVIKSWITSYFEKNTAAGLGIYNDNIVGDLVVGGTAFSFSSKEVANAEIPSGCVLCLSEHSILKSYFRSTDDAATTSRGRYIPDSTLQKTMLNLYSSGLGLTANQKLMIVPQTIPTKFYGSTLTAYNQTFFPLAGLGEKYDINTYLPTKELKYSSYYDSSNHSVYGMSSWLRSCGNGDYSICYVYSVPSDSGYYGEVNQTHSTYYEYGVRPAFVLQLA